MLVGGILCLAFGVIGAILIFAFPRHLKKLDDKAFEKNDNAFTRSLRSARPALNVAGVIILIVAGVFNIVGALQG